MQLDQLILAAKQKMAAGDYDGALRDYGGILDAIGLDESTVAAIVASDERPSFDETKRNQLVLESRIRSAVVELLRRLHRYEEAVPHAVVANRIDTVFWGDHNDTAATLVDLGLLHLELQRPELASRYFDESARIDDAILARDPNNEYANWRSDARANGKADLGQVLEAEADLRRKLPVLRKVLTDKFNLVQALNDYSQLLQNLGEHNDAERALQEAVEVQRSLGHATHPQFGILYSNLATVFLERGQFAEAKKLVHHASDFGPRARDRKVLLGSITYERDLYALARASVNSNGGQTTDERASRDLFISYNTQDEQKAHGLNDLLEARGVSCWTFKENSDWRRERPYAAIMTEMRAQLDRTFAVLVIASGTSLTSSCVFDEIEYARNTAKPVIVWYPEGTRIEPVKAAVMAEDSPVHLATVAQQLMNQGVYSFFGAGLRKDELDELSNALIYRLLIMDDNHRLHSKYAVEDLVGTVRHATRMAPYFIDRSGKRLFQEQRLVRL